MPGSTKTRIMTFEDKVKVADRLKPQGEWDEPKPRSPWLNQPVKWEDKLGDLDEWRSHLGQGRKILPRLRSEKQTTSVCNSIQMRLRKLFPEESWICYTNEDGIYLKCNGKRRHFDRPRRRQGAPPAEPSGASDEDSDLFAETG